MAVIVATLMALALVPSGSRAVQSPSIFLDMDPTGNIYNASSENSMFVAGVDNCLTSNPSEPVSHSHFVHLIVNNVEDMVAWQVRLNYIGDQMAPVSFNATPFNDSDQSGVNPVGFTNLPKDTADASSHRGVIPVSAIPPLPPDGTNTPQTALIGAQYDGAQNFPISPDVPPKDAPERTTDDASATSISATPNYAAFNGGILAVVELFVQGDETGNQLSMNLGRREAPTKREGKFAVFNGSGLTFVPIAPGLLGDGSHGEGVTCVPSLDR